MVRVLCDLCGKELRPEAETQYVVKIEIYAVQSPLQLTDADLDADNLQAVSQLLQAEEAAGGEESAPAREQHRYDLCPACRAKYAKDPLQRESEFTGQLAFSTN